MKNRRMWKAIGASVAAAALLVGGGTTFAKWYEEQNVAASNLATGELSMTTATGATWKDQTGNTIDPATYKMVPGDTVTYTGSTTITAVGDNLKAKLVADVGTLAADDPELQKALRENSKTTVTGLADTDGTDGYTVVGQKGDTANDNGKVVQVTVTVKWPKFKDGDTGSTNWGSDTPVTGTGAGEKATINLSALKLTLEQTF